MAKAPADQSFFLPGDSIDPAYRNVRDNPHNKPYLTEAKTFVELLWPQYRHLADTHFCQDATNHFLARFWEMYLAVTLNNNGFKLERYGNAGPEFFFMHNDRKVWVEAVAPGPGEGNDRVPGYSYGKFEEGLKVESTPEEKILLRFTNALDSKKRKYSIDLQKRIIASNDLYILSDKFEGHPQWLGCRFLAALLCQSISSFRNSCMSGRP